MTASAPPEKSSLPEMVTVSRRETGDKHPVDGDYVRDVWASILGPTGSLLLTRLAQIDESYGAGSEPATIRTESLASWLGVKPSVLTRTLSRLSRFRVVNVEGDRIEFRSHLGDLHDRHLVRAGSVVQAIHAAQCRPLP